MVEVVQCSECGSELTSESWGKGLCPACLFGLALRPMVPSEPRPADSGNHDLTMPLPADRPAPGHVIGGRYQVHSLLGRGGMGAVWKAFDLKLRVEVALKSLHSSVLDEERRTELIRQEVRSAREVISSNVCRIFDLVEVGGAELISMELIDGTTLADTLESRAPLELTEAREIASQFLAGLEAIHEAGLVHRDVKPENIMITRAGRVVLMDFGIAKSLYETGSRHIVGTPAYMPLEQLSGEKVDPRSDVFAAGIVLAEMFRKGESREDLWHRLRQDPPDLPDFPWRPIVEKATAADRNKRYASASALSRALEDIAISLDGIEDIQPYPGLSAFTTEDAEYFFGREPEIEMLWNKLRHPRLLALIGPSGAGKSSFLQAGVLSGLPPGWCGVFATPGNRPFTFLAQTLTSELSGDPDAMRRLLDFEEPDTAVSVVGEWRQRFDHALVIIDQFEELFTLNPREVQIRFAELLQRLTIEADVHVILSMRDDFLFRCHDLEPLHPILSELMLLGPPTGAALRRIVTEPALRCAYRFEDERLADEILTEVEHERGALPLLAFAASRLWERRDRERGLLTRAAYQEIGGVGGSLASHAEETMEKIGTERAQIVREIFRNLVTAQGTRAARDRTELLSIFENDLRNVAAEVLDTLIGARLLTSFDVESLDEDAPAQTRIEIVHESLLSAWPRLVRWQTQDADSAEFRDQLRQAAQMWSERGRPDDLLWTGTSFKEYELWRERYGGGLTDSEESFGVAMTSRAERNRRRRRLAFTGVVVTLLVIVAVITALWRGSEAARERAVKAEEATRAEARRAEASKLVALGRLALDESPTDAVAYAIASLELADTPTARQFALEALWTGPTAFLIDDQLTWRTLFSPDGKWLATTGAEGRLQVWSDDGGSPRQFRGHEGNVVPLGFFADSSRLVSLGRRVDDSLRTWSLEDGQVLETRSLEDVSSWDAFHDPLRDRVVTLELSSDGKSLRWRSWPFRGGRLQLLAEGPVPIFMSGWCCDAGRDRFAFGRHGGDGFFLTRPGEIPALSTPPIWDSEGQILACAFDVHGNHLAGATESGAVSIWSLRDEAPRMERLLRISDGEVGVRSLSFDPDGQRLAIGTTDEMLRLADLGGPPDARPLVLRRRSPGLSVGLSFDPSGEWIAGGEINGAALWPLTSRYPSVLTAHSQPITDLEFSRDGNWLVSTSYDTSIRRWPLNPRVAKENEVIHRPSTGAETIAIAPDGERFVFSDPNGVTVMKDIGGANPVVLLGFQWSYWASAFDPDGRRFAAGGTNLKPSDPMIRIWDIESGQPHYSDEWNTNVLEPSRVLDAGDGAPVQDLAFLPGNEILSVGGAGLRLWSIENRTHEVLDDRAAARLSTDRDGGLFAIRFGLSVLQDVGPAAILDLANREIRELPAHGKAVTAVAIDPDGEFVVTGDENGVVRVGSVDGAEPHLLLGHVGRIVALAISPDGRWIASGGNDTTIRIWETPDVSQPPLHTLPLDELLAKLKGLTNVRAAEDPNEASGWILETGSFPGWRHTPTW